MKEGMGLWNIAPGLIVRHTNRRLGKLDSHEACERLISGRIAYSEFVEQIGEVYRELLELRKNNDLHPGRPDEVIYCIDCQAGNYDRTRLSSKVECIYNHDRRNSID